ncbi:MAG: J domain-containing protein [Candidatus Electrothrix sp. GW3-4]|uniref:J domain-containing protein n=1 Tax=Candidatus Electrothrix sp. GW3-4 TaxID=3126740 RepID=UPI0030D17C3F
MYLARCFCDNRVCYLLRESFYDGEIYRNRDLLELGEDPGRYIVYPGGTSFYIEDLIFARLQEGGVVADYDTVEALFWPFLDPEIRARLEAFFGREQGRGDWKPPNKEERQDILVKTHAFDRRRLHFLRFGQVDQRDLDRSPSLFRILLHKSRDELEQLMLEREQDLSPHEYKTYIFTIFDLQRSFNGAFAQAMPYALNSDQLDASFLKEVCRLDQDRLFWQGLERDEDLVSYLVRYVIMFFDYSFPQTEARSERARHSFGQQRTRPYTSHQPHMAQKEAASIFGVSQAELAAMNKADVTRLYRKKAQELHPDKGGEHEEFIALTSAYNELLRNTPDD